jgi:SAM-dependent methyltransferase
MKDLRPERALARALLPPDTADRHEIVARLVGDAPNVLDVGGVGRQLQLFLPHAVVTSANVEEPATLLITGSRLPIPDNSFDAVTSLDVLEHLAHDARQTHLEELIRVARRRIVVSCPLGTADHVGAEAELAEWYARTTGRRHRFLDEHLARGLPTEAELRELASRLPFEFDFLFHGDFRYVNHVFRTAVLARRGRPQVLARYVRLRFRPRPHPLTSNSTPYTNRVFLTGAAAA